MTKTKIVNYILITLIIVLLSLVIVTELIKNLDVIIDGIFNEPELKEILSQLKSAKIKVFIFPSILSGMLICGLSFLYGKFEKHRKLWLVLFILFGLIIGVLCIVISLWFTKVNGVPFGTEMKILMRILSSDILKEL